MRAFSNNKTQLVIGGCVVVPNARFVRLTANNSASGDNDFPAVPAGKVWLIYQVSVYNASGGTLTTQPQVKISGTTYALLAAASNINNTASTLVNFVVSLIAGDVFSLNCSGAGQNLTVIAIEVDADCGIVPVHKLSFSAGDNTLYTCPANKTAILMESAGIVPGGCFGIQTGSASTTLFRYWNGSGANRTVYAHVVNSGGSPGTANRTLVNAVVTSGTSTGLKVGATLSGGDYVNINTDAATATQTAWATFLELP